MQHSCMNDGLKYLKKEKERRNDFILQSTKKHCTILLNKLKYSFIFIQHKGHNSKFSMYPFGKYIENDTSATKLNPSMWGEWQQLHYQHNMS